MWTQRNWFIIMIIFSGLLSVEPSTTSTTETTSTTTTLGETTTSKEECPQPTVTESSTTTESGSSGTPTINQKIATEAKTHIGSTEFATEDCYENKFCGQPKCNIFVAKVVEDAGASVPQRRMFKWSPIGAGEWSDPNSSYLTNDPCWERVEKPQVGDVVGSNGHCGIISQVTPVLATNANAINVAENNNNCWATDKNAVYWRYKPKEW